MVLTEASEHVLYQFAYSLYQNGLYDKSEDVFRFLVMHVPSQSEYWLGFASSLFMQQKINSAKDAFCMLQKLDAEDIQALMWLAECNKVQGNYEQACALLQDAYKLVTSTTPHIFVQQLALLQESLNTTTQGVHG